MKRIVVFALILNAALLGVIAQQFIALAGDDGPLSTRQNGDVNGDQVLDMSDAVYLLIHLFNGGPDPVALADSPEVLDRLDTLEATQGALQQGLTDLEADLPALTNDTVMYAADFNGQAIYEYNGGRCPGIETPDETWFEEPSFLGGADFSDDGKIYFSTDRDSNLLLEADIQPLCSNCGGGWGPSAQINIMSVDTGWTGASVSVNRYSTGSPFASHRTLPIVSNLPAGDYYLEFHSTVPVNGRPFCSELDAGTVFGASARIYWLSIKYLP